MGRRLGKTLNGTATTVLHNGLDAAQETTGTTVRNILTGAGLDEYLSHASTSGEARFALADALGSIVALVDSSGAVVTEYTYEPFGATGITGAPSENRAQYTDRENDGTGLYYYRARYYHPRLQRFLSEDPAGLISGDLNLYAYVHNDPTNRRDPLGLFDQTCMWGGVSYGACAGVGWYIVHQKGLCKEPCGKWRVKTRNCVCFCAGVGLWASGGVEAGDTSPNPQGWAASFYGLFTGFGLSGDLSHGTTGFSYGAGYAWFYSWSGCDYS